MNLGPVLVFVISASTFAVLDAKITRTATIRPLRIQSGVCTKTILDRQLHTQVSTKRVSKICSSNNNLTCLTTNTFSYFSYGSGVKTKLVQVCCPGYRKNPDYRCVPTCTDCNHGVCILPNVCNCFFNYERHKNGTCVPVCKAQCINSDCTSVCKAQCINSDGSCHEGYQPYKSYKNICTPVCNLSCGKGGVCLKPGVCLCARNYRLNETKQCEPICNSCENGVCIDPGICECNENYRLVRNAWNESRCETMVTTSAEPIELQNLFRFGYDTLSTVDDESDEIVNSKPKVIIETRIDEIEQTAEMRSDGLPNVILKFFTTEWFNSFQTTVDPTEIGTWAEEANTCNTQCVNGNCVDDVCICNDGYYDSELISNNCDPICEFGSIVGCINGTCVAPNTCECYNEFRAINDYVCIPVEKNSNLLVNHNNFVNPETAIKNLTRHLIYWGLGALFVLALVTLVIFIVYKYLLLLWFKSTFFFLFFLVLLLPFATLYIKL